MGRVVIRPFWGGDAQFLHIVDVQGYENPWTEEEIAKKGYNIHTLSVDDRPEGYVCLEPVGNTARLLRLVVSTKYRRQGLGSRLMVFALTEVSNFQKITTIVPETNLDAQCFLRYHDWKCVNTMKHHFQVCGRLEDGLYFLRKLA